MAKTITRQTLLLFGSAGATSNFAEFGSQAASAPVKTKSIPTIQALSAYLNGWQSAVALGQAPYLEDMNSLFYLLAYEQCYTLQEGIPEYDSGTTYYIGGVVKYLGNSGYTEFYVSLVDTNIGNALPTRANNGNWAFMYALQGAGLILPGVTSMLGNLSFVAGSGIIGTNTNNNAAAGNIGQYVESLATPSFPATSVWGDATSISLTAGDWDVTYVSVPERNGSTWSLVDIGISITPGNSTTGLILGSNELRLGLIPSIDPTALCLANYRMSLATTTTVYAKYMATYTGAIPVIAMRISARRVR